MSGDDVHCGKPDPEGYLMVADRLGVPNNQCVVIEGTPAGILAGRGAGMTVLALITTFAPQHLLEHTGRSISTRWNSPLRGSALAVA